jgi:hypothetical protein
MVYCIHIHAVSVCIYVNGNLIDPLFRRRIINRLVNGSGIVNGDRKMV